MKESESKGEREPGTPPRSTNALFCSDMNFNRKIIKDRYLLFDYSVVHSGCVFTNELR